MGLERKVPGGRGVEIEDETHVHRKLSAANSWSCLTRQRRSVLVTGKLACKTSISLDIVTCP